MLLIVENKLWHPSRCFVNMTTKTRYLYTTFMVTIGVWAIKSLYFRYFNKNGN